MQGRAQLAAERLVAGLRNGGHVNAERADLARAERDLCATRVALVESDLPSADHLDADAARAGGIQPGDESERRPGDPAPGELCVQARADAERHPPRGR